MPRSPSPNNTKSRSTDKFSRHSKTKRDDKYRNAPPRSSRRSRSPSTKPHKSRQHSPSERTRSSRRSRSASPRRRRSSRSPSKYQKSSKHYASTRRRSRSRDSPYRQKSSKSRRRRESSSTSSSSSSTSSSSSRSSSRSNSPVQSTTSARDQFIPLSKGSTTKSRTNRLRFGLKPGLTQSLFKLSLEPTKAKRQPSPVHPTFASVDQLLDNPIMPDTLDRINADGFVSKNFVSKKAANDKVIIDLDRETVSVPKVDAVEEIDPIFYPNVSELHKS